MHPPLRNIIMLAHPSLTEIQAPAAQLQAALQAQGIKTVLGYFHDEELHKRVRAGEFDMLVALGGDGTMLRASHLTAPLGLPILGINFGHFGFLTEARLEQWAEFCPRLLTGDYWLEKRMMLRAEHWRGGAQIDCWDVLNEIALTRGQTTRPIHISAHIDGHFVTTYVADGLIAASATGSTAYALAVGGPILSPQLRNFLVVPVAPHLSWDRAIVLAEDAVLSISVKTNHQAVFSADGQAPISMADDDRLDVRAGNHTVLFVRFQNSAYFYHNLTPHLNRNPVVYTTP